MNYRWYQFPGRAVLMVWAWFKGVWQDWFPPQCCRTCGWSRDVGPKYTVECTFKLGIGYGRPVWSAGICKHFRKKRKD